MSSNPNFFFQKQPERRSKMRMECSFPATVYGYAEDGQHFIEDATSANVSAAGLYMHMKRVVPVGEVLHVRFCFAHDPHDPKAPSVSVVGAVLRSEPKADGTCGLAIKFHRRRLL